MKRHFSLFAFAAIALASGSAVLAQDFVVSGSSGNLPQKDGKGIYNAVCSGCHMPNGEGAVGAGHYPALVGNEFVESPDGVIAWVLNGYKAMPPLGGIMDDAQVAAVVNYVRHDLGGNKFEGETTADDVAAVR